MTRFRFRRAHPSDSRPSPIDDILVARKMTNSVANAVDAAGVNEPRELLPASWPIEFQVGQRLTDDDGQELTVLEVLLGPFGVVYLADNHARGERTALKTLNAQYLWQDEDWLTFQREAARWRRLPDHPNVLLAHRVQMVNGVPCLEVDSVAGTDIGRLLARGPLRPARAVRLGIQICEGMAYANEHDIVHRHLKPSNCLVANGATGRDETVWVTDFGMAQAYGMAKSADLRIIGSYQSPGSAAFRLQNGKPEPIMGGVTAYLAPEQRTLGSKLDNRVDIYAFGVLLYRMLAGDPDAPPRTDLGPVELWLSQPSSPSFDRMMRFGALPRPLQRLVRRCAAEKRWKRPTSFHDVRYELEDVLPALEAKEPAP